MGKKNNVNPDHYKTRGRERPGQDIVQEIQKQKYTQAMASESGSKYIPGGEPVLDEISYRDFENDETGQVKESANSSSND